MIQLVRIARRGEIRTLTASAVVHELAELFVSPGGPAARRVELEIGFGKGRYLLQRAAQEPDTLFLGIELVSHYFRLVARRAKRRELGNLTVLHGEALYVLAALLPRGFADVVHVYFPDPWPKARHHKRRLFDVETVDLLLATLKPGGCVSFASDHLQYSALVEQILRGHPTLDVESLNAWPEGPRTHYEAKYVREGRPICRLVARPRSFDPADQLHPDGRAGLLSAWSAPRDFSFLVDCNA